MKISGIKRKCQVRGCRELETFAISRTGEMGNSVIICRKCLKEALKLIEDFKPPVKKPFASPPELFFNSRKKVTSEKVSEEIAEKGEAGFVCPYCQKVYKTEKAFKEHIKKHEEI